MCGLAPLFTAGCRHRSSRWSLRLLLLAAACPGALWCERVYQPDAVLTPRRAAMRRCRACWPSRTPPLRTTLSTAPVFGTATAARRLNSAAVSSKHMGRHYVQPQWVFDCINAKRVCATMRVTMSAHGRAAAANCVVRDGRRAAAASLAVCGRGGWRLRAAGERLARIKHVVVLNLPCS